ncbi:MAG TPA: response regulator [Chitinophagaceae bacterium]
MVEQKIIVCLDDDPDDRDLLTSAIKDVDSSLKVINGDNGIKGMYILEQLKQIGQIPCLIILDLNMPLMDGQQTLAEIKKDADLKKVPVVVFTTSSLEKNNTYFSTQGVPVVIKPVRYGSIVDQVRELLSYCK